VTQRGRGKPRARSGPRVSGGGPEPGRASQGTSASCSEELWSTPGGAFPSFRASRGKETAYGGRLPGGDHRRGAHKPVVGQMAERAPWAVPTGERSGMLVLDVDAGEGTDEGTDSVALLELSCGQPPKTSCAATGGGGVHLYFRYPSPRELRAAGLYTRQVRNSQGLLGDGLDVRGIWAATSWPHRAARCEPTGGSIGRLPPVPPGYSGV